MPCFNVSLGLVFITSQVQGSLRRQDDHRKKEREVYDVTGAANAAATTTCALCFFLRVDTYVSLYVHLLSGYLYQ